MPETPQEMALEMEALPPPPVDEIPIRNPVNGQFLKGWAGGPGRPKGSARAHALLDHSAPSLMKHSIHRATVGKRDAVLNKLLDKIVPDAGLSVSGTPNVALVFPSPSGGWSSVNPLRSPQVYLTASDEETEK